ncbi:MAG TPA: flagellar basal body rod protein FlgF [Nevskiaceae bacterium]|nr:flagellar basal body rod protein FlgF [Nevskiaceae bacterium]
MDRAIYLAMTGAAQTLAAQAVNSHNLANASTTGFRAELIDTRPVAVEGAGFASRVDTQLAGAGWDASAGALQSTGNESDVAFAENIWLAVQSPSGLAYTRAGDLRLDGLGQLRLASGLAVMGEGGPLSLPPNARFSVGGDGTLSVLPLGEGSQQPVASGRLKLVQAEPGQLQRGADGLMRARPGQTLAAAEGPVVTSGVLESSNVDLPEAMVTMIQLARSFELQVKLMKTAEENARSSEQLLRV